MSHSFESIWKIGWEWSQGILEELVELPSAKLYISEVPSVYFNVAIPVAKDPEKLDLDLIESHFKGKRFGFYLTEKSCRNGYLEYLARHGYKFDGTDCWMILDPSVVNLKTPTTEIVKIVPEKFEDFSKVLSRVFSDFPGNSVYLQICKETLEGKRKSLRCPDLQSEFYVTYENGEPVAGAGMFYSVEDNFAYLHNAGTLPKHRGKGYQSALIHHRAQIARSNGIDRIYSSVELGGQSWSNFIKCGFNHGQLGIVMSR